ncbi:MAG: hypothetical protein RIC56_16560 [Pseudomonadales bacterium]
MSGYGAWRLGELRLLVLTMTIVAGCSERDASFDIAGYRYPYAGLTQWALPRALREVSGLALDADGRLFAHADEVAVVFELDYRDGRVIKRFALGDPPRPGDYEGIAWVGATLYLVTSDGELLEALEGEDGGHVDFRLHRTGFGRRCEVEGLDYDARQGSLLLLCKTPREKALRGMIALLAWSPARRGAVPEHDVLATWPPGGSADAALNPSALTRSGATGNYVVAAARQYALLEISAAGTVVDAITLARDQHPQMEGIAMTDDGDLIVADEGKNKRGRLSVYAAAR